MLCPSCYGKYSRSMGVYHDTPETQLHRRICKHCNHKWWSIEVSLPLNAVHLLNGDPTRTLLFEELRFTSKGSTPSGASNRWKNVQLGNLGNDKKS